MKETRAQLFAELEASNIRANLYVDKDFEKQKIIVDNLGEITKLERKVESLISEVNNRANFIKLILNILSGSASALSKYEVICDMFPEIKDREDMESGRSAHRCVHHNYLSDEINEDGGTF